MDFNKIRKFCRVFRIFFGTALIIAGIVTGIYWFYLGIIPLIAGIANFCPLCIISKKCDLPQDSEQK
ncbi:YgaP family membrane protein [Sulfurimonas paralvinellae]|uniref:DUF2892 domain-containing protein n=1 Tax=Sulfurimonas paralvinellae TaxID=317658 RepID=A0A7M1BAF2_9BACT|nr:DUF2892 domain-containing protein [Sulfurimonas paralvinellae]QOP46635.1 DUF2892 domain-containing protein [Sulfurimonas paralvinellae]